MTTQHYTKEQRNIATRKITYRNIPQQKRSNAEIHLGEIRIKFNFQCVVLPSAIAKVIEQLQDNINVFMP